MNQKKFLEIVYSSTELSELLTMIINELEKELKESENSALCERITAIKYYDKSIHNKKLIAKHRSNFNKLYDELEKIPDIKLAIDGNKKAFKSYNEKLDMLEKEGRTLDSAYKDIHRFRIKITNFNFDSEKNLYFVRLAISRTINFFQKSGFTLCEPNVEGINPDGSLILKDTENYRKDPDAFRMANPEIFIPEKPLLPKEYRSKGKDYISCPKNDTYQGVHLLFIDLDGNYFEVQFTTTAMALNAKYGKASHKEFKQNTRKVKSWDLSKVSLNDFTCYDVRDKNGKFIQTIIEDNAGLIDPVQTFIRKKTF